MSCSRIRARTDGTFEPIPNTLDPEAEPFLGELDAMIEALIPLVQKDPT